MIILLKKMVYECTKLPEIMYLELRLIKMLSI